MKILNRLAISGTAPSSISTTSTSIQYFPAVQSVVNPSTGAKSGKIGFLALPGNNVANGRNFTLRAAGDVAFLSDVSSPTITFTLGAIKGISIPNAQVSNINTLLSLANSTAGEFSNQGTPWVLVVNMSGTSASGVLQGSYSLQVDNGAASTGQITSLTGVNYGLDTPLAFALGVTWSVAGSPNSANLYQFDLVTSN
jgi:hypothetical protein